MEKTKEHIPFEITEALIDALNGFIDSKDDKAILEQLQDVHYADIAEILDDNDKPVPQGEVGELTISTLGVEGMPLLRFKTGDMVQSHTSSCECGRNTMRLGPVVGRKKQMIKYKGTTLYPPVMHDLLTSFEEIQQHIIQISTNSFGTDEIIIKIATLNTSKELLDNIKDHFRAKLRVAPNVEVLPLVEINKIVFTPMSRKPITFIDLRK